MSERARSVATLVGVSVIMLLYLAHWRCFELAKHIDALEHRLQAVEAQAAQAALNAADCSEFAKELRRLTSEPRWPAPPTNGYIIVTNVAEPPKPATWIAPPNP